MVWWVTVVVGGWLGQVILEGFSNPNDSVTDPDSVTGGGSGGVGPPHPSLGAQGPPQCHRVQDSSQPCHHHQGPFRSPVLSTPYLSGGKVLCLKKGMLLKQVFALSRAATPRESRLCAAGGALVSCHRQYKSRPTHGIGKYKHLLPKEVPKRKKDKVQMKEINAGTEYEYGDVNIQMTSYDMCLVERFAQYVHKLCNQFSIRVSESYATPTKTNEVLFLEERGSKMQLDAVLTTHQRVIQVSGLSSTFAPILLEIVQSNQPEGVHLLVKEHTEADFKSRLKARPELEELLAQMS
ncbi:39S ribosomal protein L48, mitochondrial isoform X1 [Cygnus atratus]|uniref:39S ribosomal protein L48, mitochondrial isoform X1 n=1 Tax=Cygnus atratus TaxID=8868 RepID=UPI0015D62B8F|nr:39S ribosomal protein L48, mitochondrial isoform X1 [Cygnus atratus]